MSLETAAFLAPFVLIGLGVIFVAFSGGPGKAREAYLTRGSRSFKVTILLIYVGLGLIVPALVILDRDEATGGTPKLRTQVAEGDIERGKELFRETCASCHTLEAANARGVTGPSLDQIGQITEDRILNSIKIGGTGQKRMPAELLEGEDADHVAKYVTQAAGE